VPVLVVSLSPQGCFTCTNGRPAARCPARAPTSVLNADPAREIPRIGLSGEPVTSTFSLFLLRIVRGNARSHHSQRPWSLQPRSSNTGEKRDSGPSHDPGTGGGVVRGSLTWPGALIRSGPSTWAIFCASPTVGRSGRAAPTGTRLCKANLVRGVCPRRKRTASRKAVTGRSVTGRDMSWSGRQRDLAPSSHTRHRVTLLRAVFTCFHTRNGGG